jgi:hypothetical protein
MKRGNQLLLALVIVISIALSYILLNRSGSTLRGELKDFSIPDTGSVDRIFIADKLGKTSLLERKGIGYWVVNNKYRARQDAINNLLATLSALKVKAPVAKSMEANVLKDLAGPLQRKVEVYAAGSRIKTIYIGGETIDKLGTFMLLENSSVPFEVHVQGHRGFLQTRFITDERIWRDQTIFAYEKSDIREINLRFFKDPSKSYSIRIPDSGSPQLIGFAGGNQADTLLINKYIAQYRKFTFEYIVTEESFPAARKDSILNSGPFVEISVTTRKGERNTMKGYYRLLPGATLNNATDGESPFDPERIYALINDKDFVLVQYFQLDRLLVPGSLFIK